MSGDPTVLRSEQRFLSYTDQDVLLIFYTCQSILYLYFGEYEKGAELAIERGDAYAQGIPGHVLTMIETFTRGMLFMYGTTYKETGVQKRSQEGTQDNKVMGPKGQSECPAL